MKPLYLSVVAALFASLPAAAQTSDRCAYDVGAMMQMDYNTFDSTPDGGWRIVADMPGCEAAAADLLALYRTEKIEDQVRGLMHHEAQLRAAVGQTEAALALLMDVRSRWSAPEMQAYRDAEIAFLRGDLPALRAARERLANVPAPEGFVKLPPASGSAIRRSNRQRGQ